MSATETALDGLSKASQTGLAPLRSEVREVSGPIVLLLAGLAALGTLATNIILPAFPRMSAELGLTGTQLGILLSSFFLTFAVGQLVVGPLSDRFGRRALVLGGLATFLAGSIIAAQADNLLWLVLGRVVQAMGACAVSVLARAIARDLFHGEALGRVLSLTMIAGAVAPGFSPLLGSVLVDLSGWRVSFLFVALCAAALAVLYMRRVGETHPFDARSTLALGSVAATYRSLLVDGRFLLPALSVSMVLGGLFSFFAAAPGVLMGQLGLTPLQMGLSFAATVLIVFAAGLLAPRLARRHGDRTTGLAGLIIFAAGALAMVAVASQPSYLTFTGALSIVLFGMGLINPLGTAIALQPFGRQAGSASALLGFLQMGSAAIGSALASAIPFSPSVSLAIVMTAASVGALAAFAPVYRDRLRREFQPSAIIEARVSNDA
ncbi:multidrug effflux MFS transporter [Bosea sp. (in: a-proteobacteria)]|uniref:multidrug effflux MFS transporter n=1 Tax=Bosea sp. (in: a-proteobacteria) TaxID=1871050 RepID=UPI002DDD9AD9|nr:multidrug effflux MFS transporter [Bosea sp. (in: a-proteobacteria)]HEV2510820.1 multidrug effflux MFS transporter [Bosea sp. (in: a-proteobacteria)]